MYKAYIMMWKDKGYMTSGEKFISPSLNMFSNVSKAFGNASKSVQSCVQSIKSMFSKGAMFNKQHVYNT